MNERNYWQRLRRNRMTRRSLLRASARAGVGATGLALVGCSGDDDDDEQQAVAQAQQQQQQQQAMQQQQDQPQQQQAMQQEQAEQQAEQQAKQQEQQEQAQTATAEEQQQAAPQPAAGETDFDAMVRAVIQGAEGGLDAQGPASYEPQAWMHTDNLMEFDQFSKELVPGIGSFEWTSDDYTEAVFTNKPGITFHDGAPLTAEDVKFTYDRISGIGAYNADGKFDSTITYTVAAVAGEITVVDERSVRFPMTPDASAFGLMGTNAPAVPKHIVEELGDEGYANNGVGSGPFKLESFEPGDLVRSSRFEDYHVEAGSTHRIHKPYIKELLQIVRPEPLSRVAALEAGEADLAVGLPPELVEAFVDSDDFRVESQFGPNNHHIAFNTLRPLANGSFPFQDIRVRRAMNHAINIDAIIESRTGREQRHYGIASSSIGHITEEQKARLTYEYDPEQARALLAEAGYPDGFHMPYWAHMGFGEDLTGIHLTIQQDLEKVGITTDLQIDGHAVFRPRLAKLADDGIHEAPGIHYYFFNHAADPVQNIGAWVDEVGSIAMSQLPGSGIQELVDPQRAEFDQFERAKILNELGVAIYENAMFLFVIEPVAQVVVRKNLEWINYGENRDHPGYWGIRPLVT